MRSAALLLALLWGTGAHVVPARAETAPVPLRSFLVPYACPWGMAADATGCLYIAANGDNAVLKYSPAGELLLAFAPVSGPSQVAVGPNGEVFVSEFSGRKISEFTPAGVLVRSFGGPQGSGPGEFERPSGLAVDHQGSVYVADPFNDRVEVFDATGAFVRQWSIPDTRPNAVAIDANDRIYVSTRMGSFIGVLEFAGDGTPLGQVGTCFFPAAIAVDSQFDLYDLNGVCQAVGKHDASGNSLWQAGFGPLPGSISSCLGGDVTGLALLPDGALAVLHTNVVHVYGDAATPAAPRTWGRLKARYR